MYIKNIKLQNYRNYQNVNIDLDKNINILYGNNAEGKTNFIESIYLTGTTKSHKNVKEKEVINFNSDVSHIKIILNKNDKDNVIDVQLNKELKKGIALNGSKINKLSEYIGFMNIIMFSPEDLNIINNSPEVRRKFINIAICQIDKIYVNYLLKYNKLLNERNALLKDLYYAKNGNKESLLEILEALDEQFIEYGSNIIKKRIYHILNLKNKIIDIYKKISNEKEDINVKYISKIFEENEDTKISNENDINKLFREKTKKNIESDIKNMNTKYGPHRDDIIFNIDNKNVRTFGSQGQKKTIAITLKLAELLSIKEKINDTPILLLDDVFSELDEGRQKMIIENIKDIQTIITCTGIKKNIFELLNPNKIFLVSNSEIIIKK